MNVIVIVCVQIVLGGRRWQPLGASLPLSPTRRTGAGDRPFRFKFETVTNLVPGKRHSTHLSLPLTSPQEQAGEQTAAGARGTRGRLQGNRRGRQGDAAAAVASRLRIYFE